MNKTTSEPIANQFMRKMISLSPSADLFIAAVLTVIAFYEAKIAPDGSQMMGLALLLTGLFFAMLGINAVVQEMRLYKVLEKHNSIDQIRLLSWQEFERLIVAYYVVKGYKVTFTGGGGKDGGVDLIVRKGKSLIIIQCKHWKENQIGVNVVRELYGVMTSEKATGCAVITSGRFTAEAWEWGKKNNIDMINGERLIGMLTEVTSRSVPSSDITCASPTQNTELSPARLLFIDVEGVADLLGGIATLLKNHSDWILVATSGKDIASNFGISQVTSELPNIGSYARHYEVMDYLRSHCQKNQKAYWCIIDTDARRFPEGCSELILTTNFDSLSSITKEIETRLSGTPRH